jgi:hypothetical protein
VREVAADNGEGSRRFLALRITAARVEVQHVQINNESGGDRRPTQDRGFDVEGRREVMPRMERDSLNHERYKKKSKKNTATDARRGKETAGLESDEDDGEDEQARKQLIQKLRQQLHTAEAGRSVGGSLSGGRKKNSRKKEGSNDSRSMRKKRRQSAAITEATQGHDPVGPEWAAVRDIPPVEINRLGEPTGGFWDHMRPYVFDRGAYTFPWHLNWNRQCPELKARFVFRLRKLFPGPWEAKAVLTHLGHNLREKRNRLKKRFKIYCNPKAVNRPKGCTLMSWEQIYHDLRDPKKKAKSDLCKLKAHERVANGATAFAHRTGRGGYRGIVARFVRFPSTFIVMHILCTCKVAIQKPVLST